MSSVVGETGFPGDTAYAAVKAGLTGLARSLAKEVAQDHIHIHINVLASGFAETGMTAAISPAARQRITDRTLLGRFGAPAKIARATVFLSEDATFRTGTVLSVERGWST